MRKEIKKAPTIRFRGFTDDWEQRKLGDFGAVAMCKRIFKDQTSEKGDIPFYKIGTFGGVPDAYIPRELFNEYKQMYPYPEKGDILISASGSIGRTVEYTGEDAYFQDSNIVWLRHDKSIVNLFLKYLYEVIQWAGIEGSTIKRLYNDNILTTEVMIPSVQEQEKIGAYLDSIDHLITLHQCKLDQLKKLKKYFLQNMFPAKGEKVPRIRFKGFTGDWEQRKLGDIIDSYSGGTPSVGNTAYYGGNIPFIRSAEIDNESTELFLTEDGLSNSSAKMVSKGDILYALYGATSGEVGIAKLDGAINQAILAILPHEGYDAQFIMQRLKRSKASIISTYLQGGQGNLSGTIVKNLIINTPSYVEQVRIGEYFFDLDNLIALHQCKLNQLLTMKKFMLQNLFI